MKRPLCFKRIRSLIQSRAVACFTKGELAIICTQHTHINTHTHTSLHHNRIEALSTAYNISERTGLTVVLSEKTRQRGKLLRWASKVPRLKKREYIIITKFKTFV